jgi:hypothetical protein
MKLSRTEKKLLGLTPRETWAVTLVTLAIGGMTETSRKRVNVSSVQGLEAAVRRMESKAVGADTVAIRAPSSTLYGLGFTPEMFDPSQVTFPSGRTVPRE